MYVFLVMAVVGLILLALRYMTGRDNKAFRAGKQLAMRKLLELEEEQARRSTLSLLSYLIEHGINEVTANSAIKSGLFFWSDEGRLCLTQPDRREVEGIAEWAPGVLEANFENRRFAETIRLALESRFKATKGGYVYVGPDRPPGPLMPRQLELFVQQLFKSIGNGDSREQFCSAFADVLQQRLSADTGYQMNPAQRQLVEDGIAGEYWRTFQDVSARCADRQKVEVELELKLEEMTEKWGPMFETLKANS